MVIINQGFACYQHWEGTYTTYVHVLNQEYNILLIEPVANFMEYIRFKMSSNLLPISYLALKVGTAILMATVEDLRGIL